jgi:hypothetical protein
MKYHLLPAPTLLVVSQLTALIFARKRVDDPREGQSLGATLALLYNLWICFLSVTTTAEHLDPLNSE